MKKAILIVFILSICSICYALNVGERTSFNSGIVVGGSPSFTQSGDLTSTYWNTVMTDRWTDTMVTDSLWTTTMNTEIP